MYLLKVQCTRIACFIVCTHLMTFMIAIQHITYMYVCTYVSISIIGRLNTKYIHYQVHYQVLAYMTPCMSYSLYIHGPYDVLLKYSNYVATGKTHNRVTVDKL